MTDEQIDPQTEAMLDGAEIQQGADEAQDDQHTVQTHPVDLPSKDGDSDAPLTTDPEAQQDDSVINPETA